MSKVISIDTNKLEELMAVADDDIIVMGFGAPWCSQCRSLTAVLKELTNIYGDQIIVGKVDIEESMELAKQFGVMGIPASFIISVPDGPITRVSDPLSVESYESIIQDL